MLLQAAGCSATPGCSVVLLNEDPAFQVTLIGFPVAEARFGDSACSPAESRYTRPLNIPLLDLQILGYNRQIMTAVENRQSVLITGYAVCAHQRQREI